MESDLSRIWRVRFAGGGAAVPALSPWALSLLAGTLVALAFRVRWRGTPIGSLR